MVFQDILLKSVSIVICILCFFFYYHKGLQMNKFSKIKFSFYKIFGENSIFKILQYKPIES